MELALSFGIPGAVILMVAFGIGERLVRRRRNRSGTPLTATYVDGFTEMFYGSKRMERDHRDSMSMMRDEDDEGAPPLGIDLDRGVAVLRPRKVSDEPRS